MFSTTCSQISSVTGDWRELHNEELYNLYSSPRIIRMIKSRLRWAGNVARMGRRGIYSVFRKFVD
jgi:hypothetical protein